jgi:transketolase
LIPNLEVWRPCDTVESAVAWKLALENDSGPTALVFTRQGLPAQSRNDTQLRDIERGGYLLLDTGSAADAVIMASGSEVGLAMAAADRLSSDGLKVNVISMPNPDRFMRQDAAYREAVLPAAMGARVAVEAGSTSGWAALVGDRGRVIGVDRFGASAPAGQLFEHYGLTVDNVSQAVRESLAATG